MMRREGCEGTVIQDIYAHVHLSRPFDTAFDCVFLLHLVADRMRSVAYD